MGGHQEWGKKKVQGALFSTPVTAGLVVRAELQCLHPWPYCPAEDQGPCLFLSSAGVLDHLGGRTRSPLPPLKFSHMKRVAWRRVGGDLGLKPVDVAAVAQEMAFQRVTAVTFLIV